MCNLRTCNKGKKLKTMIISSIIIMYMRAGRLTDKDDIVKRHCFSAALAAVQHCLTFAPDAAVSSGLSSVAER